MVLINFFSLASPSWIICLGVFAILNNSFVARFTETSVACADKITETKKVKWLIYFKTNLLDIISMKLLDLNCQVQIYLNRFQFP